MTRLELIIAIEAAAQSIQHGQSASVGTFSPSTTQVEANARYASAGTALEAAEAGLRTLAQFLAPSDAEFRAAGMINDGCWGGAAIWH